MRVHIACRPIENQLSDTTRGRDYLSEYIHKDDGKFLWKQDVRAAKELGYPKEVVQKLEKEPFRDKRLRILATARQRMSD